VILLCYDGSSDAQAAIERAGELLSGQPATVLTVWERLVDVMARTGAAGGLALGAAAVNFDAVDAASEQAARDWAQEGMEHALAAGFDAELRVTARGGTVAETILSEAAGVGAKAIVLGSRGLTGLKSLLLGSVSHDVLQHADRTVIVVPSPEVAAQRAGHRT
jgi:nucleotide-binding universal stress UspA family protein